MLVLEVALVVVMVVEDEVSIGLGWKEEIVQILLQRLGHPSLSS